MTLSAEILSTMGVLVMQREEDDRFSLTGLLPFWFVRLTSAEVHSGDRIDPVASFPFLQSFLPTALNFWGAGKPGRIRSGVWVESDASGREIPLLASATNIDDRGLLLIEQTRHSYEQRKGDLQKARDRLLDSEQADALRHKLKSAHARQAALCAALVGTALRVRSDGTVIERHPADASVADEVMEEVLSAGEAALRDGRLVEVAGGRVAPLSTDEFWAFLPGGA